MADDLNPQLRAELVAAAGVLDPQIRGLHYLAALPVSTGLAAAIADTLAVRDRRRNLIQGVLTEMDKAVTALAALEADGYPKAPPSELLSETLATELQTDNTSLEAAVAVFSGGAAIVLDVANPTKVSQSVPVPPGP